MKVKLLLILLALVTSLTFVGAVDTQIDIYTLPLHDVSVFILGAGSKYNSLYSFGPVGSGFDGHVNFTYSGEDNEVGIQLLVKKDGLTVGYDRLDNFNTGGNHVIYYLVEEGAVYAGEKVEETENGYEDIGGNISNATEVEEKTLKVIEEDEEGPGLGVDITGGSIYNVKDFFNKSKFYILGAILFVAIVAGFVVALRNSSFGEFKKAIMHSDDRPPTILDDEELADAEKKLKEAEKELKEIRSRYTKKTVTEEKYLKAKEALEEAKREMNEDEGQF